jgi:F-type H+-transporting ATPase subunit delta
MVNRTLARRYASAVYALASEAGAVDRIGADLDRIVAAIEAGEESRRFFLAPIISRYEKERALAKVFEGRVDDVALHTLLLLVRKHREALLRAVLEEYRCLEMRARGVATLRITSARPLQAETVAALVGRIERVYETRFEPQLVVDPQLIGGVRVTTGDRRIDGTIARRLDELARTLAATT